MVETILNFIAVLSLLAFMAVSLAVWYKLLTKHEELMKKAKEERKPMGSVLDEMISLTIRME